MHSVGLICLLVSFLACIGLALQHDYIKPTPKAAPKSLAGRRALLSSVAWVAAAQVIRADNTIPSPLSTKSPTTQVRLEEKGICASGLFVNFNPGMCTKIGDITQASS
jgi:hypothetical protein